MGVLPGPALRPALGPGLPSNRPTGETSCPPEPSQPVCAASPSGRPAAALFIKSF